MGWLATKFLGCECLFMFQSFWTQPRPFNINKLWIFGDKSGFEADETSICYFTITNCILMIILLIGHALSKIGKRLGKMLDNVNNAINTEGFYLNANDDVMSDDVIYHAGQIIKTIEERVVYFRNEVPEFPPVIESLFSDKPVAKSRQR